MESFFTRYRNALVLLLVLVLQLLVLAVQAKRPAKGEGDPQAVNLLRYGVTTVITPPEKALHVTGLWFRGLWFGYVDLVHVRRDNAALKEELERLRLEQASVVEDARQGQRLQQLLGFKQHYIYQTVPAQVIGTSGTDQSGIIYIDKGSNDGLKTDMPVMTADGIVGRLKEVFPSTSQLMLISDATSGVGVILETTRTRGILKGSTYGQIQVINVSPDDRIKAGEKIITSGGDQIFPRGMPVGTVESVEPDPDRDPLVHVSVKPSANLSRLEEVLVITGTGDVVSTAETKDLADSESEGEAAQKRASDVLSERLPSRVDPNAPADTNPDQNVDSTGNLVKPLVPPKTLHADGFSPGATPPASELTPGARVVPVKNGVEELPPSKLVKAAAPASAANGDAVNGDAVGTATRKPVTVDANGVAHPAVVRSGNGTAAGTGSGTAVGGSAKTSAGAATGIATHTAKPAGSAPAPVAGAVGGSGTGSGTASGAVPVRRPAVSASGASTSGTASRAGTSFGTAAPGTRVAPLKADPTTRIIVDGPENRVPRATATPGTKPSAVSAGAAKPAGTGSAPKASGATTGGATAGAAAAPKAGATPVRKSPALVPDDGSRPPRATTPSGATTPRSSTPRPSTQTQPPQGLGV